MKEIQAALMKFDYINTDYTICERAVQYGLSFQKRVCSYVYNI